MKYFNVVLFAVVCLLISCDRHDDEGIYVHKEIVKEFEPRSQVFDWGSLTPEERRQYPRKGFVINSEAEYPNEPNINMTDLKLMDIDFTRYTLLVHYFIIPGYVKSHRLFWYYDNADQIYAFQSDFDTVYPDANSDAEDDWFTYYRAAILVNKISSDSKVSFRYSYH
ncbi:MAG: hypothetical protein K2O47_01175 [Muribaculaceae bacterium]|nr:hypothetical protein [Muribaculaceae bacterium]